MKRKAKKTKEKYDLVLKLNENTNPIIYKASDITSINNTD